MKQKTNIRIITQFLAILAIIVSAFAANASEPPKVGDAAPDFTLKTLDGQAVTLSVEAAKQPVVLIVLRGWPGYQCPICTRQVQEFVQKADAFAGKGQVLMVYPGPADELKAHAQDFLKDKHWPEKFLLVIDPDYTFTKSYGLRWDAKGETAYPSTFIVDSKNTLQFVKISKDHGGRSNVPEVLKALGEVK